VLTPVVNGACKCMCVMARYDLVVIALPLSILTYHAACAIVATRQTACRVTVQMHVCDGCLHMVLLLKIMETISRMVQAATHANISARKYHVGSCYCIAPSILFENACSTHLVGDGAEKCMCVVGAT
jgi:hypothetical protein